METNGSGMTRRDFMKETGAAIVGIAAGTVSQAYALPVANKDITWDYETDVLVVGCGTSGAAATVAAVDAGADVLVIEKKDWKGGQMRRCGGGVLAAGTQVQKALGVEDNGDDLADFLIAVTDGAGDEELIGKYARNSASLIDWIIDDLGGQPVSEWKMTGDDNGLVFSEGPGLNVGAHDQYETFGFEPKQRCHWFTENADDEILKSENISTYLPWTYPGGTGLWKTFSAALEARNVEVMLETSLVHLVTMDATNEVIGAIATDKDGKDIYIKAHKGVMLACGSFASDEAMFKNYIYPEWEAGTGGGLGYDLTGDDDGSGIRAAMSVGAGLYRPYVYTLEESCSEICQGLAINTDAQVLDTYGEPIPRLCAAGLAAGGLIINHYPCCGGSVGRSLFYGRVGGQTLAALDSWE